jgi:chromosome partitioning protein
LSLAYLLGRQGKRALLIDAGPQNAITRHFVEGKSHKTLRDLMLSQATVSETTVPAYPGVDLIRSELRLQMVEKEPADENNPRVSLHDLLLPLDYDACVIDSPPWMGMMTKSALIAADSVIVPTTLEKWAVEAIAIVFEEIEKALGSQKYLSKTIERVHIVPTFYEDRIVVKNAYLEAIREHYASYIRKNVQTPDHRTGSSPRECEREHRDGG